MNQDQIKSLDDAMSAMVAAETGYNTAQAAVQPAKDALAVAQGAVEAAYKALKNW